MDGSEAIGGVAALITACGGAAGVAAAAVAVVNSRRQARRDAREKDASIRTVTDRATASLITVLRQQHMECQDRLDRLERRLEVFERTMPVLQMRDQIMREHIQSTGALPRMPSVDWEVIERAGTLRPRNLEPDVAG